MAFNRHLVRSLPLPVQTPAARVATFPQLVSYAMIATTNVA